MVLLARRKPLDDFQNSQYLALVCLYIASKYEELDDNIPSAMEFIQESRLEITRQTLITLEGHVLQHYLNWESLNVITVLHFIENQLMLGVMLDSDNTEEYKPPVILKKGENTIEESLRKCSLFFADLS